MTQPTRKADLSTAIAQHYATPDGPPAWWTEENQTAIARFTGDQAYRESLSPYRRQWINNMREAAIAQGLIHPADDVPGHGGYAA